MEVKTIIGGTLPRIGTLENKRLGVLNYDDDNKYPQRMELLIAASGTTKRCVATYQSFLKGDGFFDSVFNNAIINKKKLRVSSLLRKSTKDFSKNKGFAIHINYNMLLDKIEWQYIPWSHCRLGDCDHEGKIGLYDDWAMQRKKTIDTKCIDWIDAYTDDKVKIQEQIDAAGGFFSWKGHVLWLSEEEGEYPLSSIDAVTEDVQSDSEAKSFRNRSLTSNFMPSHILITDKPEKVEAEEAFKKDLEKFQGARNAAKILWFKKTNPAQTIDLQKFDIQDMDKMYEVTTRTCKDGIIENFGIPSVLLNVRVAGELGGDTKQRREATDSYNALTKDDRTFIEEGFQKAFSGTTINPSGNYKIIPLSVPITADNIPDKFIEVLNFNEKRKLINYPEDTEQKNKTILATVLGVGGTQAFVSIITDTTLSPYQKRETLKLMFSLDEEQVKLLVPITGEGKPDGSF